MILGTNRAFGKRYGDLNTFYFWWWWVGGGGGMLVCVEERERTQW